MFQDRVRGATMVALVSMVVGLSAPALAQGSAHDASWGKNLHAESCAGCHSAPHDAAFYQSRKGGKIANRDSLRTMVQGCVTHFGMPWFDEEVDAVTLYLDRTHYRFEAGKSQVRAD
jgi:mono/diheme cytochrome c family protein